MVMFMTNVADAKARLSEYLDRAASGERILICRHNKPIAELRAVESARREPRPSGPLPGRPGFDIAPSFFEPLSDEDIRMWEDSGPADPLRPGSPARVAQNSPPRSPAAERPDAYHRATTKPRRRTKKAPEKPARRKR